MLMAAVEKWSWPAAEEATGLVSVTATIAAKGQM